MSCIEDPRTNDKYFISKCYDLLGGVGLGKYDGIGEHYFYQSHFSINFVGVFLPVGSKTTETNYREINARLMARRGRKNIEVLSISGDQYDGGAGDDV